MQRTHGHQTRECVDSLWEASTLTNLRLCENLKNLYPKYHETYDHWTWQSANFGEDVQRTKAQVITKFLLTIFVYNLLRSSNLNSKKISFQYFHFILKLKFQGNFTVNFNYIWERISHIVFPFIWIFSFKSLSQVNGSYLLC